MRSDVKDDENSNYGKRERAAMRNQEIQRRVAIQNSKNSFGAVTQTSPKQNAQHKSSHGYLKNSLRQDEWFEGQRRRKDRRNKNA